MKICGCLLDAEPKRLAALLQSPEVDLVEWRLDAFIAQRGWSETQTMLAVLREERRHPVLVTNRPERHGGRFPGSEEDRLTILEEAVRAGAQWVDLEDDVTVGDRERFRELGARVLVSHHDFLSTPETAELQAIARSLAPGADCIKMVAFARNRQDCLRVLELISWGKAALGVDVIAFCMGSPGRWSRVVSLLLGSPWTYARLEGGAEAAPGQYSATEIRALLRLLT